MNIYEYQAKQILKKYGLRVPDGKVTSDASLAGEIAKEIKGNSWVVKAQVLAGGRGKAGGIKIAKSKEEVKQYTEEILSTPLKTIQTGSASKKVKKVLIEEHCDIKRELYFAITVERSKSKAVVIASSQGGVEIEETARNDPSAIFKEYIDPLLGVMPYQARNLAFRLGITDKDTLKQTIQFIEGFWRLFIECDCLLAEVNPLVITEENDVVALDAKLSFDDSGLFRHPEILKMKDLEEESQAERIARESGFSYLPLTGNVGCMVNGAGLAMATMDSIKLYGGEPANFLDVGGGASAEMVTNAFSILMSDKNVKAILVNIFGGILKCDVLAEGIVSACREVKPEVPLVVRLEGTNVEGGRKILNDSGLNIISLATMKQAAQKAVQLAGA
ncbi:MAG: ADP-forming succinate--CoA ligase subunit beta [bacterium]